MSGSVHLVGTGLIGASLGIALTRAGYAVTLADQSPTSAALAQDLGAGRVRVEGDPDPDVVVVATPPDVSAAVVADALARWPSAVVTDVASVKGAVLRELRAFGVDLGRYVGSHPMAGRERSGVVAARGDLFEGRAFVVAPSPESSPRAVATVKALGSDVGATVIVVDPEAHDAAVAVVSHLPQVAASLVAARLEDVPDNAVALAGPGLRDVTRIAASDPQLWTQILAANAPAVRDVLVALRDDLDAVVGALDALVETPTGPAGGARAVLARAVAAGNAGQARIPGKHGGAHTAYESVVVLVPDAPGELGRLFADVGAAGVNLEDLRLEHGLGQPFGLAEILVVPGAATRLGAALEERGWRLHG
ncbi:Prephenate dehydrogenase [Nostocoides japonicum T1-X7]|uniref:Prephenate dehydrogenase n=1 Tax=Nostocoides japonicum T1-X7 TaxID=1194083 RepID=A0A077LVD1_9MICO|nr:prephenate dehydrogenase [Tetrasphaera japonica]CCH77893.1 Prephenate dehydrogenase [Tetrasphaera japonica T1-X7]